MGVRTLLALVETLIRDPESKAAFAARPDAFLAEHGFRDLDPADVTEVMLNAADTFPPVVAAQLAVSGGLQGAAAIDLHELGLNSLDDWSLVDQAGPMVAPETTAASGLSMADVAFDRAAPTTDIEPPVPEEPEEPLSVASQSAEEAPDAELQQHHDSLDTVSESVATEPADIESIDAAFADVVFDAAASDRFELFDQSDEPAPDMNDVADDFEV